MTKAEWFLALAALTYPSDVKRAQAGLAPYLPWFDDLPLEVFTRESLEAVVTSPRKMAIPSYDEVRRPLAAWWRDNRPAPQRLASEYPALPGPAAGEQREPTEIERQAVSEMLQAFKASTSYGKSSAQKDEATKPTPRYLADRQLLAEYEKVAGDSRYPQLQRDAAAYRARFLRAKLGLDSYAQAAE
ncbi:MAG TPA: hypothetical protein VFG62_19420 [Rhodopila sp.]|jgi:hypothetical protein|nr:hypothetical protein [Rhodopila sp.]